MIPTNMADKNYPYSSVKVRDDDYAAARRETEKLPIGIVDVITAWRILWESATEGQRDKAIKKVCQQIPTSAA